LALAAIAAEPPQASPPVDYSTHVKPILVARCYACHSALRKKSGLRLDTAQMLIDGGDAGPAVVPGKSSESYLIDMLTGASGTRMPPEEDGAALTADQIDTIKKWIDEGAHAPTETPQPDPREHWSYKPPTKSSVPQVSSQAWVRNPIDAFIAAGHELQALTPVAEADKPTLLRRVCLDLIGLPPTREELAAFEADHSSNAYETVVDRLLTSPQYGERWARHWMDVWRYSDWAGYKQEVRDSQRHIWRWRDWIVESLNADKGYDRMATEMLAGDEANPGDADTLRATGFLVRNWHRFNRDTWLQNTVEHTAKAFLATTMNCCRCHDHKFDPISQVEYYQFRAIFEPHNVHNQRVPGQADITKDALTRIGDLTPDAPTYLYERGDDKRPKKDKVIPPGVPETLGAKLEVSPIDLPTDAYYPALAAFSVQEDLAQADQRITAAMAALDKAQIAVAAAQAKPAESAAPSNALAQGNGTSEAQSAAASKQDKPRQPPAKLDAAVAAAEIATRQLATARASRESLAVRIAAERAKFGITPGVDKDGLALAAGKAERDLNLCQAQEQELVAARALATAKSSRKPNDAKSAAAVAAAEKKVSDAATALAAAHAAVAKPEAKYTPLGTELPHQSTGRRLAFARWLVDRKNPLAARVAINHIWLRHFGAPLVDNMFDFGLRCPVPRNQPLLDWLAVELMEHGWQMKHIHRLIVTSSTYRMSSGTADATPVNLARDRDNHYLWRMNARRMESEIVRDSVFFTAGTLDLTRGGPDIAFALAGATPRRSIYFQHAYEKENKLLELFDASNVNECYRRAESIVPQQALALANSDVAVNQSRVLARKLSDTAGKSPERNPSFVRLTFEQILGRQPTDAEITACEDFLKSQARLLDDASALTALPGGSKATVAPSTDPNQRARENLTLVLYNHNDFITVH
jgi:hypothetical protein